MPQPHEIPYDECYELLHAGIVGRVGLTTPEGPGIYPVNYAVVDATVVFRTSADGLLGTHAWRSELAFQVDHLDYERHQGWSVLAVGPGERIDDEDEIAEIRAFREPRPWAAGERILHVRLPWRDLTGRRLGEGWTRSNEMPVRRI